MIKGKTCWIITDGKAGTENQCIGLADNLVDKYEVKRITLKKFWSKVNPYFRIDAINPTKDSFKAYPDIAIVAGRQAISVGLHIKKKHPETLLIGVQDPRVARNSFDYIVVPQHDSYRGKNTIVTTGAMHKLTDDKIKEEGKSFKDTFSKKLKKNKTISVIIGGKSKNHKFNLATTKRIIEEVKSSAEKLKANIALTVSRRTPENCVKLIKDEFKGRKNVYIYDLKGSNPYFALMDVADYIFVTSDSMSMVTESVYTGKPVYLIELEKSGKSKKADKFFNYLKKEGIIKVLGKDELKGYKYKRIENAKKVAKKIEKKEKSKNGSKN